MDIDLNKISNFMSGGIMLGYFLAGLFFLRFWTRTRDRLFLLFAIAFGVLGVQRIALLVSVDTDERVPYVYGLRLVAFLLILWAIVDKNRAGSRSRPRGSQRPDRASSTERPSPTRAGIPPQALQ